MNFQFLTAGNVPYVSENEFSLLRSGLQEELFSSKTTLNENIQRFIMQRKQNLI